MSDTAFCAFPQFNTTPSYHDRLKELYAETVSFLRVDGLFPDVVLRCGHEANREFMHMYTGHLHHYENEKTIPIPCPTCGDPITAIFSAHYSTSSYDKESTTFSCELLVKISDILTREIFAKAQKVGQNGIFGASYIDGLTEPQCKEILDKIEHEMIDARSNPLTYPNFYLHLDTDSACTADKSASRGDDETTCPICEQTYEKRMPAYLLRRILNILHSTSTDASLVSKTIVRPPLQEQTSYPHEERDFSPEF